MTRQEYMKQKWGEPWRSELRKSVKAKERADRPRVHMPELDAEYRSHKLKEEVNQGLSQEQAVFEAGRCLDCANPTSFVH